MIKQQIKNKITSKIFNILLAIPLYGIYISFNSYFNMLNIELNNILFKPLFGENILPFKQIDFSLLENKQQIKIESGKVLIDDTIFIFSVILLLFLLVLLYRKREWSFKDADFMHFPILLAIGYQFYSFIYGMDYLLEYWDAYNQHLIFTLLYSIFIIGGLIAFLLMVMIAKEKKLGEFKKLFFIVVIYLIFLYLFSKILFFSNFYTYDIKCEPCNYFSSLEEQKEILNTILSIYGLGVFCSTEESSLSQAKDDYDPCLSYKKDKEYFCNTAKQASHMPSVKGGEPKIRASINCATALLKIGTNQACTRAVQSLYECMLRHGMVSQQKTPKTWRDQNKK